MAWDLLAGLIGGLLGYGASRKQAKAGEQMAEAGREQLEWEKQITQEALRRLDALLAQQAEAQRRYGEPLARLEYAQRIGLLPLQYGTLSMLGGYLGIPGLSYIRVPGMPNAAVPSWLLPYLDRYGGDTGAMGQLVRFFAYNASRPDAAENFGQAMRLLQGKSALGATTGSYPSPISDDVVLAWLRSPIAIRRAGKFANSLASIKPGTNDFEQVRRFLENAISGKGTAQDAADVKAFLDAYRQTTGSAAAGLLSLAAKGKPTTPEEILSTLTGEGYLAPPEGWQAPVAYSRGFEMHAEVPEWMKPLSQEEIESEIARQRYLSRLGETGYEGAVEAGMAPLAARGLATPGRGTSMEAALRAAAQLAYRRARSEEEAKLGQQRYAMREAERNRAMETARNLYTFALGAQGLGQGSPALQSYLGTIGAMGSLAQNMAGLGGQMGQQGMQLFGTGMGMQSQAGQSFAQTLADLGRVWGLLGAYKQLPQTTPPAPTGTQRASAVYNSYLATPMWLWPALSMQYGYGRGY